MPGFLASKLKVQDIFAFGEDDDTNAPAVTVATNAGRYDGTGSTDSDADVDEASVPAPVAQPVSGIQPVTDGSSMEMPRQSRSVVSSTIPSGTSLEPSRTTTIAFPFTQANLDEDEDEESRASEADVRTRGDGSTFIKGRTISADLDPTDSMIVNLKNENHPNEYIAEQLRKHGLVAYDAKTVGSRYIRLIRKIEEREAQRLEDELTDWHEGEVCLRRSRSMI